MTERVGGERGAAAATPPFLHGGGEMGALMRATDWSRTRLGPIERWPQSLRTMLGVVCGSRFPMLQWWGPDLLHHYTDAYRPNLREKHPAARAAPAAEVWAEVWEVAGPMARGVLAGEPRPCRGSPALHHQRRDVGGDVLHLLLFSGAWRGRQGRRGAHIRARRLRPPVRRASAVPPAARPGAGLGRARTEDEAYRAVATVLAGDPLDVPFALLYRASDDGRHAVLQGASGWGTYAGTACPERIELGVVPDGAHWPLESAMREGHEILVDGSLEALAAGKLPGSDAGARRAERALILPLALPTQGTPRAALVAGIGRALRMLDRALPLAARRALWPSRSPAEWRARAPSIGP